MWVEFFVRFTSYKSTLCTVAKFLRVACINGDFGEGKLRKRSRRLEDAGKQGLMGSRIASSPGNSGCEYNLVKVWRGNEKKKRGIISGSE